MSSLVGFGGIDQVVGFYFSPDLSHVLLIRKTHPEWQKGLLNGVGGSLLQEETPKAAIAREFEEEVGLAPGGPWSHFATLKFRQSDPGCATVLGVFFAVAPDHCTYSLCANSSAYKAPDQEIAESCGLQYLLTGDLHTIRDIPWLVSLATAFVNAKYTEPVEVVL